MTNSGAAWSRECVRLSVALLATLGLAGCGSSERDSSDLAPRPRAILDLSGEGGFFDLGYPTDLRQDAEGFLDLHDFPRQDHAPTERYVRVIQEDVRGFPPLTAIYLRFTDAIDAAGLPRDPAAYLDPRAPVQLIDIDAGSPERGRRFPLTVDFTGRDRTYLPRHTLRVLPVLGISLRERNRYALVVTDGAPVTAPARIARPSALAPLLAGRAPAGALGVRAREVFAPLVDFLRTDALPRDSIVAATVFTTGAPSERLVTMARVLGGDAPIAPDGPLGRGPEFEDYCVVEGSFTVPIYQRGSVPYLTEAMGGGFAVDGSGRPIVQDRRRASFNVTIPKSPMPAAGFPWVDYHHGTGGLADQVYQRGRDAGDGRKAEGAGPAEIAAERGFAATGYGGFLAQEHYDGLFALDGRITYNFLHPRAMRDHYVQLALEAVLFRRMATALAIDPALCPGADASASPDGSLRLDPDTVVLQGQSQGSIVATMMAAIDPMGADGVILSGAGGSWIESPFEVTDPIDLAALAAGLLGIPPEDHFDQLHPMLTLAEHAMGEGDHVHLAPRILSAIEPGRTVPHVLAIQGYRDQQVPSGMQRALMGAIGVDLVGPDQPNPVRGELRPLIELAGGRQLVAPVRGNREIPGVGARTAVVVHYREDGIRDGHHVLFQLEAPKHQVGCFLEDIGAGRTPTLIEGMAQGLPCMP